MKSSLQQGRQLCPELITIPYEFEQCVLSSFHIAEILAYQ